MKSILAVLFTFCFLTSVEAQLEFFTERADFESQFPGLVTEDFENLFGKPSNGNQLFFDPVNSSTMVGPIAPGDIEEGITITNLDPNSHRLLLLTPDFPNFPSPSNVMGPSTDADAWVLEFDPPVNVVGLDVFGLMSEGTADVVFFNGDIQLGGINRVFNNEGSFAGVSTSGSDVITSVTINNQVGSVGGFVFDFVDNVSFGFVESVLLGDANCDGVVDLLDVQPFVDLISNGGFKTNADINGDGQVDLLDVGPFVDILAG